MLNGMRWGLWVCLSAALGFGALRCSSFDSPDNAGEDAATSDASSPEVAPPDGPQGQEASAGCTGAALCDDFERDTPPFDMHWSSENGTALHAIRSDLGAQSPTRALVVTQTDGRA